MNTFWLIYIILFITTYILCKFMRKSEDNNTWFDVRLSILFSAINVLFLFALICGGIWSLCKRIPNMKIKGYSFNKPPNWL